MIRLFRDLRLMRSDIPLDVQAHAFSAIWSGFVLIEAIQLGEEHAPLDTQLAALTETIRRTFEPDVLPPPEVLRDQVAPALSALLPLVRQAVEQEIRTRLRVPTQVDIVPDSQTVRSDPG